MNNEYNFTTYATIELLAVRIRDSRAPMDPSLPVECRKWITALAAKVGTSERLLYAAKVLGGLLHNQLASHASLAELLPHVDAIVRGVMVDDVRAGETGPETIPEPHR